MTRRVQLRATRGSQRWLQQFVQSSPSTLDDAIALGPLHWLSPLVEDDYAEYRDAAFLARLGVELPLRSLESFWPAGGPCWDGLALTGSGDCVLVEAKAHVAEMSSTCGAAAPASIASIRSSLDETKSALGVDTAVDWRSGFYQYANRLAHAYLLNVLNRIPAHLVFLYFVGDVDMGGPLIRDEWEAAIVVAHDALGLKGPLPDYVRDAFVDVSAAS